MVFGAAALANDPGAQRAARRAARRALAIATCSVLAIGGLLTFGAGVAGSQTEEVQTWWDVVRVRALFDETAGLVAALPVEELSRLNGKSIVLDGAPVEGCDFRVDLEVSDVPSGIRIHAVLLDNRTRDVVRDFIAFRGQS